MTKKLEVGDKAPAFALLDAFGNQVSLADFAGQKVVVYFYPAAMTSGCTVQAIDFSHSLDEFAAAGYSILGISPDNPDKLKKFVDKEQLTVTLLSDPDRKTIQAYGAWGTRNIFGKEILGVLRSTFLVDVDADGEGTIALAQYSVRAKGHVDKLKGELGLA